ncbi:hypothetical protein BJ508DRAFT_326171 [Ascobolus immersus RN42]|uniref:Uncharacterized protein n=1 Tax=Ascobolus immersus RN42 TaxID=1160509 RepID=A0A3N4IBW8_ASCIM|nr:hypothetical protein BJ508DRAFT_326171 [Ascobolus immersus RN42]
MPGEDSLTMYPIPTLPAYVPALFAIMATNDRGRTRPGYHHLDPTLSSATATGKKAHMSSRRVERSRKRHYDKKAKERQGHARQTAMAEDLELLRQRLACVDMASFVGDKGVARPSPEQARELVEDADHYFQVSGQLASHGILIEDRGRSTRYPR